MLGTRVASTLSMMRWQVHHCTPPTCCGHDRCRSYIAMLDVRISQGKRVVLRNCACHPSGTHIFHYQIPGATLYYPSPCWTLADLGLTSRQVHVVGVWYLLRMPPRGPHTCAWHWRGASCASTMRSSNPQHRRTDPRETREPPNKVRLIVSKGSYACDPQVLCVYMSHCGFFRLAK